MFLDTSIEETVDGELVETDIRVDFDYDRAIPARTYGPPEMCHPAEGGDVSICGFTEMILTKHPVSGVNYLTEGRSRNDLYSNKHFMDRVIEDCAIKGEEETEEYPDDDFDPFDD
jgi:hypothetical protein